MVNYCVELLSGVLSLMAGSTTGVPMSPGYGGYQTATPPPYYTTYAMTKYYTAASKFYTTKASEYNLRWPVLLTDAPNYYSSPSYTTKAPEYYTTTYAAASYYTDAEAFLYVKGVFLKKRKINK